MNILICNDDGIVSEGILTLANFLSENNNVYVVAPEQNCSGYSHSLSFYKKIFVKEYNLSEKFKSISITGTPADCVKFGLSYFSNVKFDLVCSGVNIGANLGSDVLYSGTVAAGLEANFLGLPSIAFSVVFSKESEKVNTEILLNNLKSIFNALQGYLSPKYVLNVNIPNDISGCVLKFTKLGIQLYSDRYIQTEDGAYMLIGDMIRCEENDDDCDVEYNRAGFITVTPLHLDKTAHHYLKNFPKEIKL